MLLPDTTTVLAGAGRLARLGFVVVGLAGAAMPAAAVVGAQARFPAGGRRGSGAVGGRGDDRCCPEAEV
jgi:hypothetical protein